MTEVMEPLVVCDDTSTITVPHWGITLRRLFGAALASQPNPIPGQRRRYNVLFKDTHIATIYVQQHDDI